MFFNAESGNRKADIEAARTAEGITEATRFINYGKPGDQPTEAGTLRDVWNAWADRGVVGTSEVPVYKTTHPVHNFGPAVTVSEAVEMIKAHADEAAGVLAVSRTVERPAGVAPYVGHYAEGVEAIETVEITHPGLAATDEAA